MQTKRRAFRLFANCFPVEGHTEGLIYDLQRKQIVKIPKLLANILKSLSEQSIQKVKTRLHHQHDAGIDAYLQRLEEMEVGFFTDEPDAFPPTPMNWESPYLIENAIIEIDQFSAYDVFDTIDQLNQLGCNALQFRFINGVSNNQMKTILTHCKTSRIKVIELFVKDENYSQQTLKDWVRLNSRVTHITLHSSDKNQKIILDEQLGVWLHYETKILLRSLKDLVKKENFIFETSTFLESQTFNIGLNKKVCIDVEGNIKNYLSHHQTFGNLSTHKISDIVASDEFRKKWLISNNQIEKCKDCQFRYACLSNSDIKEEQGKLYKTDDCNFDPYSNSWKFSK